MYGAAKVQIPTDKLPIVVESLILLYFTAIIAQKNVSQVSLMHAVEACRLGNEC